MKSFLGWISLVMLFWAISGWLLRIVFVGRQLGGFPFQGITIKSLEGSGMGKGNSCGYAALPLFLCKIHAGVVKNYLPLNPYDAHLW